MYALLNEAHFSLKIVYGLVDFFFFWLSFKSCFNVHGFPVQFLCLSSGFYNRFH